MVMTSLADTIRQFCRTNLLRLNTDLGQHFLVDQSVLDAIMRSADIRPGEQVVEIGPGIGVLTRELLAKQARVTAIEIDPRMIPFLRVYTEQQPLEIIQGNALRVPMPSTPYTIVANIPYHITSPLLRHVFLESTVHPRAMTLLIQREVAEKICDTRKAGLLTILVGLFGKPSIITKVPAVCFLPPPNVESAVLHVQCFPAPLADAASIDRIFRLTKTAFAQKRKMISNTLGKQPGGPEALKKAGIDLARRPETLSIPEWIALADAWDADTEVPPDDGTEETASK